MLIKEIKKQFLEDLSVWNDPMETESLFYIVLEKLHNFKRIDLALSPDLEVSESQLVQWIDIISELKTQKPIQYILGETEFFGLNFKVNENTLIPRQETEELIQWILDDLKTKVKIDSTILDVGTGSGCIAISLSKNLPKAKIFALDVSQDALKVASKNAVLNQCSVTFLHQNILEVEDLNLELDILVSNPPYVRNLEKDEIKPNVLQHEPHLALFVEDNDALLFYRKIGLIAQKNLKENGYLYFEINQYLGQETLNLVKEQGFKNCELRKDIFGNDRMIRCQK
jgi:release factor glutamine methyltransferase